jgi:hypothetical protein
MRPERARILAVLWLCLVGVPLLRPAIRRPGVKRLSGALPAAARRALSPSGAARREAGRFWARAQARVSREREAVEAWDPRAAERLEPEGWRRQLMACDEGGDLRRAKTLARLAAALARTPAERYAVALLEARLGYDAGDTVTELRAARRLAALQPRRWETRVALWRAARDSEALRPAQRPGRGGAPGAARATAASCLSKAGASVTRRKV